jgi:hypothetical protein
MILSRQLYINVQAKFEILIYINSSICNKTTFLPMLELVFSVITDPVQYWCH